MHCRVCGASLKRIDSLHLLDCCGITLQEYSLRYAIPLELLVDPDSLNAQESTDSYPSPHPLHTGRRSQAALLLNALHWTGLILDADDFLIIPGEIRRLDLLLWDLQQLKPLGFQFRQEYEYSTATGRVISQNRLKIPKAYCAMEQWDVEDLFSLAVMLAHKGENHGRYLYLPVSSLGQSEKIRAWLIETYQIATVTLEDFETGNGALLRTATLADTDALIGLLRGDLKSIPFALERLIPNTTVASVTKAMDFDSAHFITDHPGKCSNQHGGRYRLEVSLNGPIDPATGFVVDYGRLKRVMENRVIKRMDHHHLNFAHPGLSWRSSSELLAIFIWQQILDYFPELDELVLHETANSCCRYRGPSLAAFQENGQDSLLSVFQSETLGSSPLRNLLKPDNKKLKLVRKSQ